MPLKTFHEGGVNEEEHSRKLERKKEILPAIRLSYHGKAHYNSIVPTDDYFFKQSMLQTPVGQFENKSLELAKIRVKQREEKEENESRETAINEIKKGIEHIDINDNSLKITENTKLEALRGNFIENGNKDIIIIYFTLLKLL